MIIRGCLKPFAAAYIGMAVAVSLAAPEAHADDASVKRCPPGYWLLEPVCIDQSSGDVVKASPAAPSPVAPALGCAPDYERLGRLCISSQTGDVEIADEQRWPAEQRAELRN